MKLLSKKKPASAPSAIVLGVGMRHRMRRAAVYVKLRRTGIMMRALTAGARSVPDSDMGLASHSDGGAASLLAGDCPWPAVPPARQPEIES